MLILLLYIFVLLADEFVLRLQIIDDILKAFDAAGLIAILLLIGVFFFLNLDKFFLFLLQALI
jgi:hypothetical protein